MPLRIASMRARSRQLLDTPAELLDGIVQRPGNGPELIRAMVVDGAGEIAG